MDSDRLHSDANITLGANYTHEICAALPIADSAICTICRCWSKHRFRGFRKSSMATRSWLAFPAQWRDNRVHDFSPSNGSRSRSSCGCRRRCFAEGLTVAAVQSFFFWVYIW